MRTSFIAVAALVTILAASASAQEVVEQTIQVAPGGAAGGIQLPGLGMPRQFKTGSGRIRGRVVASDTGGPVRRATVSIAGMDIPNKNAMTDAQGRFEFRDLPSGKFTLNASKAGFVSVQFGQSRPFESGTPIELAEKQFIDNANISMPRGGVISGRIVDEYGDPFPDVYVTAVRLAWMNGRRRMTPSASRSIQTNDLGQYRLYGLPPGEYYVSATSRSGLMEMPMFDMMEIGGVRMGGDAGPSGSVPTSGYAPTYFPGTPNGSEAQKITLAASQEATGVDFALAAVRLAKVSGLVISSDGKPFSGASVSLSPASRDFRGIGGPSGTRTTRDGTFTLNSVPPGDYILQVSALQVVTTTATGGDNNTMVFRSGSIGGSGEQESGSMPLAVAGEDISNLMVTTAKGGTASGRVTFDGPRPQGNIRVSAPPVDTDAPVLAMGGTTLKEDGTFELKGLTGTRLIRVIAPVAWQLKSVKLNGIDITDTGAEFKAGESASGLEVEMTNRTTSVTGTVSGADGAPLKDYTVIIFPEAPELWRLTMNRWVTGQRPDHEGRFKAQNLPAGRYLAVALGYVPQGEWGDPELLDRLKAHAKRFTLDEGGTQTLDLRVVDKY